GGGAHFSRAPRQREQRSKFSHGYERPQDARAAYFARRFQGRSRPGEEPRLLFVRRRDRTSVDRSLRFFRVDAGWFQSSLLRARRCEARSVARGQGEDRKLGCLLRRLWPIRRNVRAYRRVAADGTLSLYRRRRTRGREL